VENDTNQMMMMMMARRFEIFFPTFSGLSNESDLELAAVVT
jgi:hypothetical protein